MNYLKSGKKYQYDIYVYIFGLYVLDSALELKRVNLYINEHFIDVIIDIGSITSNKVRVAISSRQCLTIYVSIFRGFFNLCCRFFMKTVRQYNKLYCSIH